MTRARCRLTPTTLMEIPLPVILGEPPMGADPARLRQIMAAAAQDLGTLAVLPRKSIGEDLMPTAHRLVPILPADFKHWDDPLLAQVPAVEIPDHPGVVAEMEAIKQRHPQLLVWIRVPADSQAPERVSALAAAGAEVLHLAGSDHARGVGDAGELHLKDLIRRCHLKLVEDQAAGRGHPAGRRRHRPGGARGQGHRLRRRRHPGRHRPAPLPGMPPVQGMPG